MAQICSFCGNKDFSVLSSELVFVEDSKVIQFKDVLSECFIFSESFDVGNFVCQDCFQSTTSFYTFKQKIHKNLKRDLENKISKFLAATNEQITVVNHNDCLSLVPATKQSLMENFVLFNPMVYLETKQLNEPKTIKLEPTNVEDEKYGLNQEQDDFLVEMNDDKDFQIETNEEKHKIREVSQKVKASFTNCGTTNQRKGFLSVNKSYQKINRGEEGWLAQEISSSKIGKKLYKCSQCNKILHSLQAIRYHIIHKHMRNIDPQKRWIKFKIKQSHQIISRNGSQPVSKWSCDMCSRTFSSAPAIRYHFWCHLQNEDNVDLNSN